MPMRHEDAHTLVEAAAPAVFAFVDDHEQFSAHMSQSSWMLGGGRMVTVVDDGRGQRVGSHIRMSGTVWGITLTLDEIVTEHVPPHRKAWETVGDVRLVVVGPYRMQIDVTPHEGRSQLRVGIDYDLPRRHAWLGRLFGRLYAKWCVRQMATGVKHHFG